MQIFGKILSQLCNQVDGVRICHVVVVLVVVLSFPCICQIKVDAMQVPQGIVKT